VLCCQQKRVSKAVESGGRRGERYVPPLDQTIWRASKNFCLLIARASSSKHSNRCPSVGINPAGKRATSQAKWSLAQQLRDWLPSQPPSRGPRTRELRSEGISRRVRRANGNSKASSLQPAPGCCSQEPIHKKTTQRQKILAERDLLSHEACCLLWFYRGVLC
jgi:hypothetical protein